MLTPASAIALLAGALLVWPRSVSAVRLARATRGVVIRSSRASTRLVSTLLSTTLPDSRLLRAFLVAAAVGGLAQLWPWPVAVVVVAVGTAVVLALVRASKQRSLILEETAAVEGLGVLVAELRAGRPADEALAAAGRHCGQPAVGAWLSRLGRSLRLGDRLEGGFYDVRAPPSQRFPDRNARSEWRSALLAGLRLSQQTGCALADVVAAVETDLAGRGNQRADLRATASGHRATAALLAGLPILGLAMGSGIGAEPVRILTATTIGHVLLLAGVGLELLGLAWSARMTGRAVRGR